MTCFPIIFKYFMNKLEKIVKNKSDFTSLGVKDNRRDKL